MQHRLFSLPIALFLFLMSACGTQDGDTDSQSGEDVILNQDSSTRLEDGRWVPRDDQAGDEEQRVEGPGDHEFQVNTYVAEDQMEPAVALLPDGGFVVAWQSGRSPLAVSPQDGSGWGVYARRFDQDSVPVEEVEFCASEKKADSQTRPSVASYPNGAFIVVWESLNQDGAQKGIFGQRFTPTGAPLGEFQLNITTKGSQSIPTIATMTDESLVACWQSSSGQDGDDEGIFVQRFASNGLRVGTEVQANTFTTDGQTDPDMAWNPSTGDFVVVWSSRGQDNGIGVGVYAQRFSADAVPLDDEFQVNIEVVGQQEKPAAAWLEDGSFVLVWQSFPGQDGDGSGIFARIYAANGIPQTGEFQVNSFAPGHQTLPDVASVPGGGFVVVWQSCASGDGTEGSDGDGCGIVAQFFDANRLPSGAAISVNETVAGNQGSPSIVALADGSAVCAWASQGQDAPADPDGYALMARRIWRPAQ